ncbi:MAG: leucine-rich repeat protein, partial [Muribaculaceae bacterium]|nr:leucine-rich repeat protein [Muribaculaceae bacterium]
YSIASRQNLSEDNYDMVDGNYYIKPYFSDGTPVEVIEDFAFSGAKFNQLIIEYSDKPIAIGSWAFEKTMGQSVTINRSMYYSDDEGELSYNIFEKSTISAIALPQDVAGIAEEMFIGCSDLTNIYFIEPKEFDVREKQLGIITAEMKNGKANTVYLPRIESFTSIGSSAFSGAIGIKELHIPQNVKNVGATIFRGWDDDQIVYVDYNVDDLPQYDSSTGNGWHIDWRGNFNITNVKFRGYAITFEDDYSNNVYSDIKVDVDSKIGELPNPTNEHAVFKGWFTAEGVQYTQDTIFTGNSNVILYAKWVYEIKYYQNGKLVRTKEVGVGEDTYLANFTQKGYIGYLKSDENKRYEFGELFTPRRAYSFDIYWEEKPIEDCHVVITYPYVESYYEIYGPNQLRSLDRVSGADIRLMNDIDVSDSNWTPITEFAGHFDGQGHTITFKNDSVSGNSNFGFFETLVGGGGIENTKFKAKIRTSAGTEPGKYVGVIAAMVYGYIDDCEVLSSVNNPYYYSYYSNNVDILVRNPKTIIGGMAGYNIGTVQDCTNNASIAGHGGIGGIVGENQKYVSYCVNNGTIFYDHYGENSNVGGIAGYHYARSYLTNNVNYAAIYFKAVSQSGNSPCLAQIVGYIQCMENISISQVKDNSCYGSVYVDASVDSSYTSHVSSGEYGYYDDGTPAGGGEEESKPCVAPGTLITLADGSQKPVEHLTGSEMLLVWNMYTGTFDVAPILFIDSESSSLREVIYLYFSDSTEVKVIYEHAFWDFNLNEYVFLRNDASKYIGH